MDFQVVGVQVYVFVFVEYYWVDIGVFQVVFVYGGVGCFVDFVVVVWDLYVYDVCGVEQLVGMCLQVEDCCVLWGVVGVYVFEYVYFIVQGMGQYVCGCVVLLYQFIVILDYVIMIGY